MLKRTCLMAATLLLARMAFALPPPRAMYTATLAREQSVRGALVAPDAAPDVLSEVHAVVAAYESLVRRYPASGYADNALWQAGRLLLDAYARFSQPQDKDKGVRLLKRLEAGYPTSRLVKQVPGELARVTPESAAGASPVPPPPAQHARSLGIVTIKNISRSVLSDAVRVTIELDGEVPFHEERISDPERVFLDLPSTRAVAALLDQTIRFDGDADVVRQIRIGRHPNSTTRVVLEAAGVSTYSVYPLYDPYRLVIDCVRGTDRATIVSSSTRPTGSTGTTKSTGPAGPAASTGSAGSAGRPALLPARRVAPIWQRGVPAVTPQHGVLLADTHASAGQTQAAEQPAPSGPARSSTAPAVPAAPPVRNSSGGFSIARQLGLGVSRIVIDPGHGGHDPGAKGKGVDEAELVLDIALRLEKLLQKQPGAEVILTRRTDEFIPLQERTAMANREGADLFLSIHANASASAQARGIETYFLNFANNLSAAAVAARENAASGQAMAALPDLVKAIALNNKLAESRDFATEVQHAMLERLRPSNKTIKDLGVKQAPFAVLIGAAMPSVLAEVSFVTNPQEARLLKGNLYRQRVAEALFNAIRSYQTSLKSTQTVAPQ